MFVYLLVLMLVITSFYNYKADETLNFRNIIFISVAFISLVLTASLRSETVGTDSPSYVYFFEQLNDYDELVRMILLTWEFGFWLFVWLIHLISDNYFLLFFSTAVIVITCYQCSILSHSINILISQFVFITMGFYTFFFNGARQGIACSIYSLAIGPLIKQQFKPYLVYVFLATIFHKSAIIAIPFYFINTAKTLKVKVIFGLVVMVCAYYFMSLVELISNIDSRYMKYAASDNGGGYLVTGMFCALSIFFITFSKYVTIDIKRYNLFLNMFVFGTLLSVVASLWSVDPSGIMRLSMYFNISAVFLWAIVFKNLEKSPYYMLFLSIFVFSYILYYILATYRFSNLIPYHLNPMFEVI